jgi:hypothetical protein
MKLNINTVLTIIGLILSMFGSATLSYVATSERLTRVETRIEYQAKIPELVNELEKAIVEIRAAVASLKEDKDKAGARKPSLEVW